MGLEINPDIVMVVLLVRVFRKFLTHMFKQVM